MNISWNSCFWIMGLALEKQTPKIDLKDVQSWMKLKLTWNVHIKYTKRTKIGIKWTEDLKSGRTLHRVIFME